MKKSNPAVTAKQDENAAQKRVIRQLRIELKPYRMWMAFQKWTANPEMRSQVSSLLTTWEQNYDVETEELCLGDTF